MVKSRAGRVAVLAALLVVGLCAPLAQPARAATTNYSGSLASGAAKTYTVPVTAGQVITANLTWSASADLNISLKNPSGAVVAKAFSTPPAGPEKVAYVVPSAGTYIVAVSSKTGSASRPPKSSVSARSRSGEVATAAPRRIVPSRTAIETIRSRWSTPRPSRYAAST